MVSGEMSVTIRTVPEAPVGSVLEFTNTRLVGSFPAFDLPLDDHILRVESPEHVVTLRNARVNVVQQQADARVSVTFDIDESTIEVSLRSRARKQPPVPAAPPKAIPRIPGRGHFTRESWEERLRWLEEFCGTRFKYLSRIMVAPESLKGNVESFIGTVHVPVGAAGPLLFRGQYTTGYVVAPYATSEGALVTSATRGARAISLCGGVYARTLGQSITRAPVFVVKTIEEGVRLAGWIEAELPTIRDRVRQVSRHAELVAISPVQNGNMVHARFIYRTGDAAGQNMSTICTWEACQWILEQVKARLDLTVADFFIEANMSGDKKVTFANMTLGRGVEVTAEAQLSAKVVRRVLHVEPEQLLRSYELGMVGSVQGGMVGANVNVANSVAAIFAATGQDIGCVHESSGAVFHLRREEGGIYASIRLPNLMVGTVGGGTALPTQRECLQMMGCFGPERIQRLAEIVAGFSLALDLSTLGAIASQDFALAHERLGRNRLENGFKEHHLSEAFFDEVLRRAPERRPGEPPTIEALEPFELDTGASILSDLGIDASVKKIGHFPFAVRWRQGDDAHETRVVVKSKATDDEMIEVTSSLAQACGGALARVYSRHSHELGLRFCHIRELEIAELPDERLRRIAPHTYLTRRDDKREVYVLVMESLEGLSHLNTVDYLDVWTPTHIRAVLRDIAGFHAIYYDRPDALEQLPWIDPPRGRRMVAMGPLWRALLDHNTFEFPEIYTTERVELLRLVIDRLPGLWRELERAPRTLVHNDFNLRNIALRPTGDDYTLCAYDWELATMHVPQHDVAEFLAFALPPGAAAEEWQGHLEHYREALERELAGRRLEPEPFRATFDLCCCELAINRFALYAMAHTLKEYSYLPRVLGAQFHYLEQLRSRGEAAFSPGF